jgi:hypothetical protein
LIVGSGQYDRVRLSAEAQAYFDARGVEVIGLTTPQAVQRWNEAPDNTIGLFHVTC